MVNYPLLLIHLFIIIDTSSGFPPIHMDLWMAHKRHILHSLRLLPDILLLFHCLRRRKCRDVFRHWKGHV